MKENGVSANEKITNKLELTINLMTTDETEEYINDYLSELLNESIKQETWIAPYLKIDIDQYLYDMVTSACWQIYAIKNNDEFEYFVFEQERFEDEADYIVGTYCE